MCVIVCTVHVHIDFCSIYTHMTTVQMLCNMLCNTVTLGRTKQTLLSPLRLTDEGASVPADVAVRERACELPFVEGL